MKQYTIYPSQVPSFNEAALLIATAIAGATNTKTLSAFKRNDCLAIALGYKGASDLVQSTKFRSEADMSAPLHIFNDEGLLVTIGLAFAAKVPTATAEQLQALLKVNYQAWHDQLVPLEKRIAWQMTEFIGEHASHYLRAGSPTHVIISRYAGALAALRSQATIAVKMFQDKSPAVREALRHTQRQLSEYSKEAVTIIKAVRQSKSTVPSLEIRALTAYLLEYNPYFWHLNEKPIYFAAEKTVSGKTYRYLTQFFSDAPSCGGHSGKKEDLMPSLLDVDINNDQECSINPASKAQEEELYASLKMPSLCTDIFILDKI